MGSNISGGAVFLFILIIIIILILVWFWWSNYYNGNNNGGFLFNFGGGNNRSNVVQVSDDPSFLSNDLDYASYVAPNFNMNQNSNQQMNLEIERNLQQRNNVTNLVGEQPNYRPQQPFRSSGVQQGSSNISHLSGQPQQVRQQRRNYSSVSDAHQNKFQSSTSSSGFPFSKDYPSSSSKDRHYPSSTSTSDTHNSSSCHICNDKKIRRRPQKKISSDFSSQ